MDELVSSLVGGSAFPGIDGDPAQQAASFADLSRDPRGRRGSGLLKTRPDRLSPGAVSGPVLRVALICDLGSAFDVQVMRGVAAYFRDSARRHTVFLEDPSTAEALLHLGSWKGQGIIANIDDPAVERALPDAALPVVGFTSAKRRRPFRSAHAYFSLDNELIISEAVAHLRARGFQHLAFCAAETTFAESVAERQQAFVDVAKTSGFLPRLFSRPSIEDRWEGLRDAVGDWLRGLPKPVGVVASSDLAGREVLEACRVYDLRVPSDVAVVGIGNDELLCCLNAPALTSVESGASRLGYEAAVVLDQLIDGRPPDRSHFIVSPLGVDQRMSTDVIANGDPEVVRAMTFIREHASVPLTVPDVVAAGAVSRSTLEGRFRAILNCTIMDAIRRAHLERARRLVSETTLPLKHISVDSGFKSVQHMTNCFVKAFGQTPGKYRPKSQS